MVELFGHFKESLLAKNDYKITKNTVTLLLPSDEIGFRNKDYSLISKKERTARWIEIVNLITKTIRDFKVFIKPHPDVKNFNEIKNTFESISISVEVVNPSEPVDKYIKMSNVIIGMPRAASSVLFYASLAFPEKAIISLDFDRELGGDFYKDFDGVEYIDNEDKFTEMLGFIAADKYKKVNKRKKDVNEREFLNTIDMLNYLYSKKITSQK